MKFRSSLEVYEEEGDVGIEHKIPLYRKAMADTVTIHRLNGVVEVVKDRHNIYNGFATT